MLSIIAAIGRNLELGANNKLLWHLPDDLKRFKKLTTGHTIIMGRKTFEAIGQALPNRKNIIMTRQSAFQATGCLTVNSLDAALTAARDDTEIFIIGGAEIYASALPRVNRMYLTCIDAEAPADTYFPPFAQNEWRQVASEHHAADEKHLYSFTYKTFDRL